MAAKQTERAYEILLKNPDAIASQIKYLEVFPQDKDAFIRMFNPDDNKELHSVSQEHLETFQAIGQNLPDSILRIGLAIGKNIYWSKGPVDQLQHILLITAAAHPELFVDEIYLLSRKERDGAVAFLSNVEADCKEYTALITSLNKAGAFNIAGALTRARVNTH